MNQDRFDGILMALFISVEFAALIGVSAWALGDLGGLSLPMHYVALALGLIAVTALLVPLTRRMLAPSAH